MIICDSHTHSSFSFDAEVPMEDMVKGAIKKNINVITSDILNVKVYDTIHKLIDEEFLKQTDTFKNIIFDYVTKSENNL